MSSLSRFAAGLAGTVLLFPLLQPPPAEAQTPPSRVAVSAPAAVSQITNPSFEQSTFTWPGADVVAPGWSFFSAGVFFSPDTWSSAAAPDGQKIAWLQGAGATVTQSLSTTAGRHSLSFYAAQRPGSNQRLRVSIGGTEVGIVQPAGESFTRYRFDALLLASGATSLQFQALDPGDNTVVIDYVNLVRIDDMTLRWSQPSTWIGGVVPQAGDAVLIPAEANVLVDVAPAIAPKLKSIDIAGELHCADSNVRLDAEWVLVTGRLICGAPTHRYTHQFELTLSGTDPGTDNGSGSGMGGKFLAAMAPGVIELHGEQRVSWVQLAATATADSNILQLTSAVDWRIGDEIVVAPTVWRRDPGNNNLPVNEAEATAIRSVLQGGTAIEIKPRLTHAHLGASTNYTRPDPNSGNGRIGWMLDERAEVGLLTRNIRIQGDVGSATAGYGGHMMTMQGSTIHASGLELRRMGQKGKLARYPFHWHLAREAPGQYIQNSSVHESYNRCVTVHGTHQVRVADNVCYNFIGHGYFLEDGIERDNVFDHNLGIWARRPAKPDPLPPPSVPERLPLATDYRESGASNGPAVFWISNPSNTFVNNAAAGSEGTGYWYHTEELVREPSRSVLDPGLTVRPRREPFGVFRDNRVRASRQGYSSCELEGGLQGMEAPGVLIERLSVTDTEQGIWPCAMETRKEHALFRRAIVANTDNGMQAPSPVKFEESMFLGYSNNPPPRAAANADTRFHAVQVYDQGFLFDTVHFENYDRPTMSVFRSGGGAHKLTNNRVRGLTFRNAPQRFMDLDRIVGPGAGPAHIGDIVHDLDGSYAGAANRAAVADHPLMLDAKCRRPPGSGFSGYACPYRYAQFRLETYMRTDETYPDPPAVTTVRSDGTHDSSRHIGSRFINEFITNSEPKYEYAYRFDKGIPRNNMQFGLFNAFPGETSIHELLDVPDDFTFLSPSNPLPGTPCAGTPETWAEADSLADLRDNLPFGYWYNTSSHSLYVKLRGCPLAANWYGEQDVMVCMGPLDTDGQCGARDIETTPPSATILSPADGAHVSTGNVTIEAEFNDPANGIASVIAFVGEQASDPQNFAPEFPSGFPKQASATFVLNIAQPGRYPIKVVATNGDGRTYTAISQLLVGQTTARVSIATPVHNQTLDAASSPLLSYTLHNVANLPAGAGFRLLEKRVNPPAVIDHGAVSGAPVSLAGWSQGRHDVEIALVLADGSATPVKQALTFHLMRDGQLADYEDGVDARGGVEMHSSTLNVPVYPAWQSAVLARNNGADDINYFILPVTSLPPLNPHASYWLRFDQGLNLSAYNRVRVVHAGPAYDLYAHTALGGVVPLGTGTQSGYAADTFSLAGVSGPVYALELRQLAGQMQCSGCLTQHLYNISVLTPAQP